MRTRIELEALIGDRTKRLAAYQNAAYAERFARLVREIAAVEKERTGGDRLSREGCEPVHAACAATATSKSTTPTQAPSASTLNAGIRKNEAPRVQQP